MTNTTRILTHCLNLDVGILQALVISIIAEFRHTTTEQIALRMGRPARSIAPLINSLKERGYIIQMAEKAIGPKRQQKGPRSRVQWRLDHRIQDGFNALEARTPLPNSIKLEPIRKAKRPAARVAGKRATPCPSHES